MEPLFGFWSAACSAESMRASRPALHCRSSQNRIWLLTKDRFSILQYAKALLTFVVSMPTNWRKHQGRSNVEMRCLTTIAVVFGLTAATLASRDVRPALADPEGESFTRAATWLCSQEAFGGAEAWSQYSSDDQKAVRTCARAQWCRQHFGGRIRPDNLAEVYAKLKESGTPLSN
jgi:hypothetical protein